MCNKQDWAKEPWRRDDTPYPHGEYIVDCDGNPVAKYDEGGGWWFEKADMDRVFACINVCQGMPTEKLVEVANDPKKRLIVLRDVGRLHPRVWGDEDA